MMRFSATDLSQGQNLGSVWQDAPQNRSQANETVRQYPKQENTQVIQREVPLSSWPEEWRHLDILASDSASLGSWRRPDNQNWEILR